ncbi:MAG: hypothetical protein P4L77_13085 [Sulfuriferula sp.]|nr:hypothetical protein [Sulfuriferula sp.]
MKGTFSQITSIIGASGLMGVLVAWVTGQITTQQAIVSVVPCSVAILLQEAGASPDVQKAVESAAVDMAKAALAAYVASHQAPVPALAPTSAPTIPTIPVTVVGDAPAAPSNL